MIFDALEPKRKSLRETSAALTGSALAKGLNQDSARKLAMRLNALAEREMTALQQSGTEVACRKGCDFCCHGVVPTNPIEATVICGLIESLEPSERENVLARMELHAAAVEGQKFESLLRMRTPCPFLSQGECMVYEHRPLACRGLFSEAKELCQAWFESKDPAYPIAPPNEEDEMALAVGWGVKDAAAQAGINGAVLPISIAVLARIAPERMPKRIESVAWRQTLGQRVRTQDPAVQQFEAVRSLDPKMGISHLRSLSTAQLMAGLWLPTCLESEEAGAMWLARFDIHLELLENVDRFDPLEAYRALDTLQFLALSFYGIDTKPRLERVGKLLNDRIAAKVAPDLLEPLPKRKPGKLRVGFAGFNFRQQSGANWALGWVQRLDRARFETYVIKLMGSEDALTYQFKDAADHFYHLDGDPLQIARFIREQDLDYLLYPDLGDEGLNHQFAVFRLARRQGTGWGSGMTTGLPTIDDIFSSDLMEPADAQGHYTENLVRMPGIGVYYEPFRPLLQDKGREHFGLPKGRLATLCQGLSKWHPKDDGLLAEISHQIENPLLVFDRGSDYNRMAFRKRMERVGARVAYMGGSAQPRFYRILQLCDLSLDPPEWSGGHTSIGTLQFGTPIVSMAGQFMRGRQGLAFLPLSGVPEMVVPDRDAYRRLALDPQTVDALRPKIDAEPLFRDNQTVRAFERHIESVC